MEYKLWKFLVLKVIFFGLQRWLNIESTCGFYRGPQFRSQHPHLVPNNHPWPQFQRVQTPSCRHWGAYIHVLHIHTLRNTNTHQINKWSIFITDYLWCKVCTASIVCCLYFFVRLVLSENTFSEHLFTWEILVLAACCCLHMFFFLTSCTLSPGPSPGVGARRTRQTQAASHFLLISSEAGRYSH